MRVIVPPLLWLCTGGRTADTHTDNGHYHRVNRKVVAGDSIYAL